MTREEFLKAMGLAGLGVAVVPSLLMSCKKEEIIVTFSGKVIIIGAGAAGLMAGHLLHQYGIDFVIIEAKDGFGGRVKRDTTLADFPIDLGAEWVHESPDVFSKLIQNPSTEGSIELIPYNPAQLRAWYNNNLLPINIGGSVYGEYKFKHSTWYDFFEDYIVPDIQSKILYHSEVGKIHYDGDKVTVSDEQGIWFIQGDKCIVTLPTKVLQKGKVEFLPALPQNRYEAINAIDMPDGIKVFMEFSERFYPDLLSYGSLTTDDGNGEVIYYDAAFKKDSSKNILALFSVGSNATQYTSFNSDQELIDYILGQLDEIYDGKATASLQNFVVQNWSQDEFIGGSYSFSDDAVAAPLNEPVDQKIYFSGEALGTPSATVHGAGLHAIDVAKKILEGG